MDNRTEVCDFLTTRRERLTPEQAGIPSYGGRRRVKGLRREEVAMLAGMSTDYYTRLERGNLTGVSAEVLESLARALRFDEAERAHLFDLAATSNPTSQARRQTADTTRRTSAPCSPTPTGRRPAVSTWPGTCSWTLSLGTSTSSGTPSPATRSPHCASTPAAPPTTGASPTWSVSCPPAAASSPAGGPPTR
ncbi:Transcriptional regulator (fragment) [Modestobacter italicus]|uniref:Transcriptional regulator n=1 Tax=Modestobacter italicus (strain DSM 44449 / CECT 9708 / BC 501) TaxID=2732864 RepID=I4EYT2_MODI5